MSTSVSEQIPYQALKPLVVSPLIGGVCLVGVPYYLLTVKTALQTGEKASWPSLSMYPKSIKACPPLVGQIFLNKSIEEIFKRANGETQSSLTTVVKTTIVAGALSTPLLAALNGYTMSPPRPFISSVRALTFRECSAIMLRESSFLLTININKLFAKKMKERFQETPGIDYVTGFFLGMAGSAIGHAPDSALTIWQKGQQLIHPRQLARGFIPRAVGIGFFNVKYIFLEKYADKFL